MTALWEKYAKVLVDYSVNVQKGDLTLIRATSPDAQPLVKEIYKRVLEKGGSHDEAVRNVKKYIGYTD